MIYIIEDDSSIREMESYALINSGYQVKTFADSTDFYKTCKFRKPSLVVLDIMLPKEDGLTVLQKIRADKDLEKVPVVMVTAKTTEIDKVKGLDLGADDYITKPFGVMEFVSRIKAVLRRCTENGISESIKYKNIIIDDSKRAVLVDGEECILTFKEYELLKYLFSNIGVALTREKLIDTVWGYDFEGESRTVDMHIKTLRKKIGDTGEIIKTVRNVGYKVGE